MSALRLFAAGLALIGLIGCDAPQEEVSRDIGTDVLAPFEDLGWPTYLRRIDLAPERDYVVLAYVPPANPIDLSTPEKARGTMARLTFDQLGAMQAGTTIGHLIVAWQCGGVRGMTSMSGERDLQGQKMYLRGWGVTPILSSFLDGHIVPLTEFPDRQNRALVEGRGAVVASEVTRAQCNAARRSVENFVTHPENPAQNYSLVKRPDRFEGGGCLSFAMHVASDAGVMPRLMDLTQREIDLRAVQLGARPEVPEGVEVYAAPGHPETPVHWLDLLTRRWDEGPVIDRVTVPDGEAILAALTYARIGTAPKNDWRYSRLMTREDPIIDAAARHGLRWAYSYPNRRIADPDGVSAIVLER